MKRTIARMTFVIVFAIVFVLGIVPGAQAGECSNATLHGSFGYTATGTLLPAAVRPHLSALLVRLVGRPSTGMEIQPQPRL